MVERSKSASEAFRKHRHDVLNGLQLIRAYIQLERPLDALRSLDQLAKWMRGLSLCQAELASGDNHLLWVMSQCNMVCLTDVINAPPTLKPNQVLALEQAWFWLDDNASEQQTAVDVTVQAEQSQSGSWKIQVRLAGTEENPVWWNTVGEARRRVFGDAVEVVPAGVELGRDV